MNATHRFTLMTAVGMLVALALGSGGLLVGCESKHGDHGANSEESAREAGHSHASEPAAAGAASDAAPVEVAEGGTRFDPPVSSERIPDGAWMCDMGKVHYAALHTGKCAVCGMNLTQKGAAPSDGGMGGHMDHMGGQKMGGGEPQ